MNKNLIAFFVFAFCLAAVGIYGRHKDRQPGPPTYEGCLRYETGRQSILQAAVDWSNNHSGAQVFCFPEDDGHPRPFVFCTVANQKYIYNLACHKTHCELDNKRPTMRERERLKKAGDEK